MVATRRLQDPRLSNSGLDRTLNDLLVLMLASEGTGVCIPAQRVGGKLPTATRLVMIKSFHTLDLDIFCGLHNLYPGICLDWSVHLRGCADRHRLY